MTSFAKICAVLAVIVTAGTLWHGVPECAADGRFSSLQRLAQGQIERIKAARERAAEQLERSEGRSCELLRRSQEDLIRRIEHLERVREEIQDQVRESDAAGRSLPPIAMQELCVSLSEIGLQLNATRALAKQLEAAREEAEAKATAGSVLPGSASGPESWNKPCGCGGRNPGQEECANCAKDSSNSLDPLPEEPPKFGG